MHMKTVTKIAAGFSEVKAARYAGKPWLSILAKK